eukprot:CAMPEP_0185038394 /NCGR_PEP_ID=MMETSP1103-20130426/33963_1 /TAXON_ID=36769 /ORGANISM="Paraphysomonas bandaiensis, Strain Caron Lab Isolate" /LENGTH=1393 /DNA_ID=CAMNT_0027576797 /DNA_START=230 /DNA_END=4411 /DNA_ORIENTATION=-
MATTNAHTQAQADIETAVDINELKRRIERRDNENKRKDREISLLQKEVLSLTKEIHGLRDRNDQLQHSLTNARLLTAASREDTEARITNSIIVELEAKLARTEKELTSALGDLEESRASGRAINDQLHQSVGECEAKSQEISNLKEELYTANLKIKTFQIRLGEKDAEYEKLRLAYESTLQSERNLKGEVEHLKTDICEQERSIAELSTENKRMRAANTVKQETNALLRNQVDELNDKTLVLSKEEMERFKEIERNNATLQSRNNELVKSVELHMDLLQRSEADNSAIRVKLEDAQTQIQDLKEDAKAITQSATVNTDTFNAMKKEVVKLRRENKQFAERLDSLLSQQRDTGALSPGAATNLKNGVATLVRHQQGEAEGRGEERRKRKIAEEASRALRNRISYLLEQLEQASALSATWKEQKALLKAQINSLNVANIDLRERLVTVQRNFMDKTLYELDNPSYRRNAAKTSTSAFLTDTAAPYETPGAGVSAGKEPDSYEDTVERLLTHPSPGLTEREGGTRNILESTYRLDVANPLPNTVEGFVERQLFDVICGFTTGERQLLRKDSDGAKPTKKVKLKENYSVRLHTDGLFEIFLDKVGGGSVSASAQAEAEELLVGLQVPAFLKFVQTRHPDKIPAMFTEKLATVLNFFRQTVQDYLCQLGESRMATAKLQSKVSYSENRVKNMQHLFSLERIAKQKNVMKYVREQMRLSDLRKVMDEISRVGRDNLDDIEVQRREIAEAGPSSADALVPDNHRLRGLLLQLKSVAEHLSASAAFNNTDVGSTPGQGGDDAAMVVGAIEVRLPESQIDDETLHGVVGLLCGALGNGGIGNGDNNTTSDDERNTTTMARESGTAISKNDMMMASGLGIQLTGEKLTAASLLAKTLLTVQSNYTDRVLLLNLKDNVLTDISCKILGGLVEKSSSLRMLDVRGNMISPIGAKMLFDATRRNSSVLYVTQRQNGFMIEGHREIMGTAKELRQKKGMDSSGIVGRRASEKKDEDEDDEMDMHTKLRDEAAAREVAEGKKHPLRIDIRNNNPEQEAVERLLESTEFGVRSGYHAAELKKSATRETIGRDTHNSDRSEDGDGDSRMANYSSPARSKRSFPHMSHSDHVAQRPVSASSAGRFPPRGASAAGILRPKSSGGMPGPSAGIAHAGSRSAPHLHTRGFGTAKGNLLPDLGESDSEDEDLLRAAEDEAAGDTPSDSYLRSKLIDKKNERLEGVKGAGVGSLLDTEIRKMQQHNVGAGQLEPQSRNKKKKKVVSLAARARRGSGKKVVNNGISSVEDRQRLTRSVYNNPVVRSAAHVTAPVRKVLPVANTPISGGGHSRRLERNKSASSEGRSSQSKMLRSKTAPSIGRPQINKSSSTKALSKSSAKAATVSNPIITFNPGVLF